jgi:AmmeMemoRadiSam system radical SAM enzyme
MEFYRRHKDDIECTLCQHYCHLKEDKVGICGVNKNVGEKIECLVYGYLSALNIDPIEKKPLYHFLPSTQILSLGTIGCNFHCHFCQNWSISQERNIDKSSYFSPQKIVSLAKEYNTPSIAFTYNEPTIFYPYARDIAIEAKSESIKSVYVSNGYESDEVIEDMEGIIDAINIDLKSFNEQYYQKKLGADLHKVLDNIKYFAQKDIWMELTTLIVPGKNDSTKELEQMAAFIADNLGVDTPWHLSAFHPNYKAMDIPKTSIDSLQKAHSIAKEHGIRYVYLGNVNTDSSTYCPTCNTLLIERDAMRRTKSYMNKDRCPVCSSKIAGVF